MASQDTTSWASEVGEEAKGAESEDDMVTRRKAQEGEIAKVKEQGAQQRGKRETRIEQNSCEKEHNVKSTHATDKHQTS